ncbi:unnamed protein product, partial [Laminaria digitata]
QTAIPNLVCLFFSICFLVLFCPRHGSFRRLKRTFSRTVRFGTSYGAPHVRSLRKFWVHPYTRSMCPRDPSTESSPLLFGVEMDACHDRCIIALFGGKKI